MLTEKCPFCGSYNDVEAAVCYFCHKDLPDTPGHKKKRPPKQEAKPSITLPPSMASAKKKTTPGCLLLFCGFIFLACGAVIFQVLNNTYKFLPWEISIPATQQGTYLGYYLQELIYYVNALWEYPAIAISSIVILGTLCWGLLSLKKWARTLAMVLFIILLIGNIALFVRIVMYFDRAPISNINFILSLVGIGVNSFCLVWFFEHKKNFD